MDIEALSCCGIKELHGITGNAPETILQSICQDYFDDTPRAFIIFSIAGSKSPSGRNLAKYLKANNLGPVTKMRAKQNPNSGHRLHVWMWAVNNRTLKSLCTAKGWYKYHKYKYRGDSWTL